MAESISLEALAQIANSNGVFAGNLLCKGLKQDLHKAGLVWPAYGADYHLTPRGKAYALANGIDVAPFSWIHAEDLVFRAKGCIDSEWDRERIEAWLKIALDTNIHSEDQNV